MNNEPLGSRFGAPRAICSRPTGRVAERATADDERGAVAPFVALLMVLLLGCASFAVDIGQQRVARRDMQALADIVAMDMSRRLDGRTASALQAEMATARDLSVARNSTTTVGDTPEVSYELGILSSQGNFVPVTGGMVPSAVRVAAGTSIQYAFRPGSGAANRAAVATAESSACFSVGSYAAALRTEDSPLLGPLLGLLGTQLNLTVADMKGLANLDLSLLGLVDAGLGVGTLDELVNLRGVKLADFYIAMADVLRRDVGNTAEVLLLQALAVKVPGLDLNVADIIAIGTGGNAGLGGRLNVFDLVATSLFVANGENAVALPDLGVNLGNLVNLNGSVKLIQKPSQGCGRSRPSAANPNMEAHSAQLEVKLSGRAVNLDIGLLKIKAGVDVLIELAPVDAILKDVTCRPGHDSLLVSVGDSLLKIVIKLDTDISLLADLIPVAKGGLTLTANRASPMRDLTIDVFNENYNVPGTSGSGNIGLPDLAVHSNLTLLGGIPVGQGLAWVLNPILDFLVEPLLQGLDKFVLSPLLEFLGVQVSGASIYALPKPVCGQPALRG